MLLTTHESQREINQHALERFVQSKIRIQQQKESQFKYHPDCEILIHPIFCREITAFLKQFINKNKLLHLP